ncbi:MAG: dihydrodipicolinate synthase family protein [Fuerstiella sp.]|nr:dihydrodipicolinate synthase family protein [Fuerstiella sp.]
MTVPSFHGVWPAMITPLDEQEQPNYSALEQLVELFISQNVPGLYILGSTGQWPLLSLQHRREIAERVVKIAAGRITVMVHVGALATDDAADLARHAESIGADAVSAVGPVYYSYSADAVFEHYQRIGSASNLPLFVYHLSHVNQVAIPATDYARRVLDLPNIGGMKFTDHDLYVLSQIHETAGEKLLLFSGADQLLCHAALSGATGAIGSFYNLWAAPAQKARDRFVAGDFDAGYRFMMALQAAISRVLGSGSVWSFLKTAMHLRYDINVGMPRRPLGAKDTEWDDDLVRQIVTTVEDAAK